MLNRNGTFCCSLLLVLAVGVPGDAAPPASGFPSPDSVEAEEGKVYETPSVGLGSGRTLLLFPRDHLYPPYIADPHRTGFGVLGLFFSETGIAESGSSRVGLKAGGRLGFVRIHPPGRADRGWQLSVEGGFDAQFDTDHSLDNIGWDGNYGLVLTTARSRGLALMFGVLHTSSHVGDEYTERTGRRRIGYTRGEFAGGVSWFINEHWRAYAEAAWGYELRKKALQEPGRLQLGVEFEDAESLWKRRLGWYAALDASAMEERDLRVDTSLQIGIMLRSGDRTWRLGIERYDGRPPLGEFFQDDESYIALGLWMDM